MTDNSCKLSVGNDLIVIRKFNDEYYTETLIKGYYSRKKNFKEYDWMLFGGSFKNALAVTKIEIDGFHYFGDVSGNLLYDKDGLPRFYEDYKPINHSDDKLEQSISRSKRNILELCMCNDWDYFVTITIDAKNMDRFNIDEFKDNWKKFIHTYNKAKRNKSCQLKYILVPELHPTSHAYHLHGLIKGGNADDYITNDNGYLEFKPIRERFGFMSCSKIKAHNSCACYMTKYITKELGSCVSKGKQCYICSQKLKRPKVIACGDNLYVGNDWDFENDHIKKSTFYDDSFLTELQII